MGASEKVADALWVFDGYGAASQSTPSDVPTLSELGSDWERSSSSSSSSCCCNRSSCESDADSGGEDVGRPFRRWQAPRAGTFRPHGATADAMPWRNLRERLGAAIRKAGEQSDSEEEIDERLPHPAARDAAGPWRILSQRMAAVLREAAQQPLPEEELEKRESWDAASPSPAAVPSEAERSCTVSGRVAAIFRDYAQQADSDNELEERRRPRVPASTTRLSLGERWCIVGQRVSAVFREALECDCENEFEECRGQ